VTRARLIGTSLTALSLSIATPGCTITHHVSGPAVRTTVTRHHHLPTPVRTIVRNYRTYRAGQTGVLDSPSQHASLQISVSPASTSSTRLSTSYGYAPANGHYVTFRITIRNTGRIPIVVQRLDFWVRTPGAKKTTTDDGNAPYSGSGTELDTTELTPGEKVSNNLTFDVATASGTLLYGPNGKPALAWTF
jgi:hypothetical protein